MIWNSELKKDIATTLSEIKAVGEEVKQARIRTKKQIAALNARIVTTESYLKTIASSLVVIAKQLEDHSKKVDEMLGGVIKEKNALEDKASNASKLIEDAMHNILDSGNLGFPEGK